MLWGGGVYGDGGVWKREKELEREPPGARTQHNLIKSQVLYQLS